MTARRCEVWIYASNRPGGGETEAILFYLLLVLSAIYGAIRRYQSRVRAQNQQHILEEMKQIDKLKDDFLANTSHELRTPLNGIIGLTDGVLNRFDQHLPAAAKQDLGMVISSGKRLSRLVNDILDFSKLKDQSIELKLKSLDLHTLVAVVLNLSMPLVNGKDLKLQNEVAKSLPAVLADEDRLLQILHNLVGNAIKFTQQGSVTVAARHKNNMLVVDVVDTGIGIAEDQQERIFDSFVQAEGDIERVYGGTGIGLAVTRQLVELHGGTLRVASVLQHGSTFTLTLPVSDAVAEPTQQVQPPAQVAVQPIAPSQMNNTIEPGETRLLLVDDDPVNLRVLHGYLDDPSYALVDACDGEQALAAMEDQGPFDLVLLDVMMPKLSGYEVCKHIREQHSIDELPVILLTAKDQLQDVVAGFAAGANDHVTKPIAGQELVCRVNTQLSVSAAKRALAEKHHKLVSTQQQLVQAEKMASLGTLTYGVAHEINNPNNFVYAGCDQLNDEFRQLQQFILDLAGDDADPQIIDALNARFEPVTARVKQLKEGSERIGNIVSDLKLFSEHRETEKTAVKITDCLQATVNLVKASHQDRVHFDFDFIDEPMVVCYPAKVNQVFMQLVSNACEAIKVKQSNNHHQVPGNITLGCRQARGKVLITVSDDGCGMDEQACDKVFEPFYTTKTVGEGTGLGLSISYGIVQQHDGQIRLESESGKGSVFTVEFPIG